VHPDFRPKWKTNSDEERGKDDGKEEVHRRVNSQRSEATGTGRTAVEMAREVGVSTFTIYAWKAKYGGMEPSETARLSSPGGREQPAGEIGGRTQLGSGDAESASNKSMVRRSIASSNSDEGTSLRKSIRPDCGQSPGLDENPLVSVLIMVAALKAGFLAWFQTRRWTVLPSLLLLAN
jgi:hypothetical protein